MLSDRIKQESQRIARYPFFRINSLIEIMNTQKVNRNQGESAGVYTVESIVKIQIKADIVVKLGFFITMRKKPIVCRVNARGRITASNTLSIAITTGKDNIAITANR